MGKYHTSSFTNMTFLVVQRYSLLHKLPTTTTVNERKRYWPKKRTLTTSASDSETSDMPPTRCASVELIKLMRRPNFCNSVQKSLFPFIPVQSSFSPLKILRDRHVSEKGQC